MFDVWFYSLQCLRFIFDQTKNLKPQLQLQAHGLLEMMPNHIRRIPALTLPPNNLLGSLITLKPRVTNHNSILFLAREQGRPPLLIPAPLQNLFPKFPRTNVPKIRRFLVKLPQQFRTNNFQPTPRLVHQQPPGSDLRIFPIENLQPLTQ